MTTLSRERIGTSPASEPSAKTSDRFSNLIALLPGLVTFAVGYYGMGRRELWNDEFVTWHSSTLSLAELRMLIGNIDLVHALYYAIMRGWVLVAGDSPADLRLLSVVALALTAVCVTVIGRRLFDAPVGVVAGLLFVGFPAVSRYAQEARSYAMVTLAATVATWLLLLALDRPSRLRWWLYAASVVCAGWLHFVALLVLAGHLVYVFRVAKGHDERRWQWGIATGWSTVLILPLLIFARGQSGQISWVTGDWGAVKRLVRELIGTLPALAVVATLTVLALALAGQARRPPALMLLVWAVLPPVVGYLTFTWLHLFMARYFLFTLPAWALLVALGACEGGRALARERVPQPWIIGAALVLPVLGYVGLPAQMELRQSTLTGQPTYRSAIEYLAERAKRGDGIAFNDGFGGSSDLARKVADYELRGRERPRDVFLTMPAREHGWLTAVECADPGACVGDTARIWLVETGHLNDSLAGLPAARAALLRESFSVAHVQRFDGVRVVELTRRPAAPRAAGAAG